MGTIDRSVYHIAKYTTYFRGSFDSDHQVTRLFTRTRSSNNMPDWRRRIRLHGPATTALSGNFCSITEDPTDSFRRDSNGDTYAVKGYLASAEAGNLVGNPSDVSAKAVTAAMMKAYGRIKSAQRQMQGAVFLGEIREAVRMVKRPAAGLRDAIERDYLQKLAKRLKGAPAYRKDPDLWKRAISQTWLEGIFGWRPFINDLQDAVKAYENIRDKGGDRHTRFSVGAVNDKEVSNAQQTISPILNFGFSKNTVEKDFATVRLIGEVRASCPMTTVEKARCFGLSPGEFWPTAWELLPWSFLVDYFVNIGDVIDASYTDTSKVSWLNMTIRQIRTKDVYCAPLPKSQQPGNCEVVYGNPSYCQMKRRKVSRTQPGGLSVPSLIFSLPGSSIRQLNMLSLWTQANSINPQSPRKLPKSWR